MLQEIIGKTRKAIDDFEMIDDGDKIAVGLSGGKDSITLLYVLYYLRKFYPKKFNIMAISIHPGSDTFKTEELEKLCKELDIEYLIYNSNIADVVFNIRKEKNPCSLCANMRRGMLNSLATEHGCNKIALGHHMDDLMETFLMSLFLNGKIHTFAPVTYLSRSNVKTIRPMIYVEEKLIRSVAKHKNYPVMGKCCPADGFTKRDYMTELLKSMRKDIPRVKEHVFGAIKRSNIKGWEKLSETSSTNNQSLNNNK
ncbi:MAG: tRNA 2-thiocytidine biosynthesis TtcA family protein [Clostridia bacterium]|nr:tRNA 2-thiocytidine biosynthesis TtcA family protein [Clostridia bacterium]MDD4376133.1 tRNA 2-thiocytidine biosynthesis TtcA family protein [Clostridia bacterium]